MAAVPDITLDRLCDGIRAMIEREASQDGGPSLDSELVVCGVPRGEALRRVLEVKGELVIRIKPLPEEMFAEKPAGAAATEELAARLGATKPPLML